MRRVTEERGGGLLARAGNPDSLAEAILRILRLPDAEWLEMGERGRVAVETEYHWATDARRMMSVVQVFAASAEAR